MANAAGQDLDWLEGDYAICRLDPHARLGSMPGGPFFSLTRTVDELSVVCLFEEAPAGSRSEGPYAILRIVGELPLELTGILASILNPLAAAGVPIFGLSTFDTDYVLVRRSDRERAEAALVAASHRFASGPDAS
jgi:hypothetical protein